MTLKTVSVLSFLAGGLTGAVTTYFLTKNLFKSKYEKIANDDINQMREYYEEKAKAQSEVEESTEKEENMDEVDKETLTDQVRKLRYAIDDEEDDDMYEPKPIPPEEMWERDYPTITLIYYEGDDVLTDSNGKIIVNSDELVGEDFADHFGEYEEDSVHIKNDKLKVYYEILKDIGSFSEADHV